MLGYKSATLTVDLYEHLFDDQMGSAADALDAVARAAVEADSSEPSTPSPVAHCDHRNGWELGTAYRIDTAPGRYSGGSKHWPPP